MYLHAGEYYQTDITQCLLTSRSFPARVTSKTEGPYLDEAYGVLGANVPRCFGQREAVMALGRSDPTSAALHDFQPVYPVLDSCYTYAKLYIQLEEFGLVSTPRAGHAMSSWFSGGDDFPARTHQCMFTFDHHDPRHLQTLDTW